MIATLERSRWCAWLLLLTLVAPPGAMAQAGGGGAAAGFNAEQLEHLAAPIALYPDPLLAQILMASTYPLEVAQAARFVKDNPKLQGAPLDREAEGPGLGRQRQVALLVPPGPRAGGSEARLGPEARRRGARTPRTSSR